MKNNIIVMVSNPTGKALFNHILGFICLENKIQPNFEVVCIKSNMLTYRKGVRNYYIDNIQSNPEILVKTKLILLFESSPTDLELKLCNKELIKQDLKGLGADVEIIKIKENFEAIILQDIVHVLEFLKLDDSIAKSRNLQPYNAIKYLFSEAGFEYSYNDIETIGRLIKDIKVKNIFPSICPNISPLCSGLGLKCRTCLPKITIHA